MMRPLIASFILVATILCPSAEAQQTELAREELLKEEPRYREKSEEKIYIHSYDEYGWVKQGSRKGHWNTLTHRVAYLINNIPFTYMDFTVHDRFDETDYAFDFGSYAKFQNGYVNAEAGFGADVDYVYKFKTFLEVEHRLIDTLFFNIDGRYSHYSVGDVYIASPGLVYYFGNSYLSGDYGVSFTEDRGSAHFGTLRGNFAVNEYLSLWLGGALGQRLYDINLLDASKQDGYILFTGTDIMLDDNAGLRLGWSYSREDPSFEKSSVDFRVLIKF